MDPFVRQTQPENLREEFLSVRNLSSYMDIKVKTIYSMVEKREIPFYKIGRLVRFKKSEIDAWVKELKFEMVSPQAEAREIIDRVKPESGCIVKKNVAHAKALGYTPKCGRSGKIKDLGKGESNV